MVPGTEEDAGGAGRGGEVQREEPHDRFLFLHWFAGNTDKDLGHYVVEAARRRGLRAEAIAVDKLRDGADLATAEPAATHLRWAREGRIDGFHAGPVHDVLEA